MNTLFSTAVSAVLLVAITPRGVVPSTHRSIIQTSLTAQAFEVASVKPRGPFRGPAEVGVSFLPGGRVVAVNAPVYLLLTAAFGLSVQQLDEKGIPDDLQGDVFDIEAKAGVNALPENATKEAREARLRLMLQTLLVERFKLRFHKETRDVPMYALTVAAGGSKLKPSPANRECPPDARCGHLSGGPASGVKGLGVDINELVDTLISFGDRHVVDQTKITGTFDIDLPPWSRSLIQSPASPNEPNEDPNGPSIFAVLRRTLGLQLISTKNPLEIYVIDHIERPSPNLHADALPNGGSR